jgi:hypothetical protein
MDLYTKAVTPAYVTAAVLFTAAASTFCVIGRYSDRPGFVHPEAVAVERIEVSAEGEQGTIILADGMRFTTSLFEVSVLGILPRVGRSPYLILAGNGCRECDAHRSIYVHSPSDGPMANEGSQVRYAYPGREFTYDTRELIYQSRMFVGDCLTQFDNTVVWFERSLHEIGTWNAGVYVVQSTPEGLVSRRLDVSEASIEQVEDRVTHRRCREIPGKDYDSEP